MLSYLRFRWKVWRLERALRTAERGTEKAAEAAKKRGAFDEIDEITGGSDAYLHRRRIHEAMTRYLEETADRLVVPVPDFNDPKMWVHDDDRHYLTREGIAQLRSDIRAEKKARRESILIWVTTTVGVLGSLIGLVSALKR
jgi:hypothetical protein